MTPHATEVYTTSKPSGWKTAYLGLLHNHDFASWLRGEGTWEIRSTTVLRAAWFRWRPLASARTREDCDATLEAILEQVRGEHVQSKPDDGRGSGVLRRPQRVLRQERIMTNVGEAWAVKVRVRSGPAWVTVGGGYSRERHMRGLYPGREYAQKVADDWIDDFPVLVRVRFKVKGPE